MLQHPHLGSGFFIFIFFFLGGGGGVVLNVRLR